MSWYFLGGFSAYAIEPSARLLNHSGCSCHPRMVRRGLQRQVQARLSMPTSRVAADERVEVLERAQVRVDRVVPAVGGADRPRRARIALARRQRVVPALAERGADGMHRRQVHHVEAHGGDRVEPLGRGAQRARDRRPVAHWVNLDPFGAREELVPRAVQRPLPVHLDGHRPGPGDQLAHRPAGQDGGDLRILGRREPVPRGQPAVAQPYDQRAQRGAGRGRAARPWGLRDAPRGTLEQQRALGQHQLHVLASRNLDGRVMVPAGDRVGPGLHVEAPQTLGGHGHVRAPAVGARRQLAHVHQRSRLAPRISKHDAGIDDAVPFAENRGADLEGLAIDGLCRAAAALDRGLDIKDRDSSNHPSYATEPG